MFGLDASNADEARRFTSVFKFVSTLVQARNKRIQNAITVWYLASAEGFTSLSVWQHLKDKKS